MMQSMRHLAQTKVFKGLMMILMVSFALWGIGDIFRGNPMERSVAKAGKTSISVQALNHEFEEALMRARQMFGPELSAQQAKQMGILDKTLDAMIERAEVDQMIKKLGIDASPKMVLDQVAAQPQFRDKNGNFNKALFQEILENAHLNERTFIAQAQQDMARHQLIDVFSNADKPPQSTVDALYKARGQKRILDVITIKNDSIKDIPASDEATLRAYYQQNSKAFTAPEYRSITIARLSSDDVLKETVITDDQVQKEYNAKIDQMSQPERRDVVQVVLQDEGKAKLLAASAHSSGNLTGAAKTMGYESVLLPATDEKTLLPELAKPVFALQNNQVSEPVKSSLGWHVLQVKKITPAGRPEFKDVKNQLRQTMQRDQAIEAVTHMVNQLDDQLAAGHALEDIADGMKLRMIKIPNVDARGKTPEDKDPSELPNKDDVLKTAFAQGAGEVSPIIDDKNGNYIVIRTDEVTASALRPFDQVKDDVADAWKAVAQAQRAAALAEKITEGLRSNKPASSFAGLGIEVRTSKPISMIGDTDPALPPSALPLAFKLKMGEAMATAVEGKQIILRLSSVEDVGGSGDKDAKIKISEELKKNYTPELTEEYIKYLHTVFPVDVNRDVLETIRQQGG